MSFEHVGTLPGSPQPKDIFEPYMPDVDVLSDTDGFFKQVREMLESENVEAYARKTGLHPLEHKDVRGGAGVNGQRHVAIITPGRMINLEPAPLPNTKSEKELAPIRALLASDRPLKITAISYTKLEAYVQDRTKTKCIPFLGMLLAFAYLGHNVLVFEGHPSALAAGVKDSDLLFINSGMLPFMGENWAEVVFPAMKPNARALMHERKTFRLTRVVKKSSPPGWERSEPDGEPSYINMLLTTLGKANYRGHSVHIVSGEPLPNPKDFTTDPEQLEYISKLPFHYDKLRADVVIKTLWNLGKLFNAAEGPGATKSSRPNWSRPAARRGKSRSF